MQKRDTGHVYAMKILKKSAMVEKEQVRDSRYTIPWIQQSPTGRLKDLERKKVLKDFGECHENSLTESFKMNPT